MKTKMQIYSEMYDLGLCCNQSDFSRNWLGRKDSYFRAMNHKGLDWSAGVRGNLIARIRSHQKVLGWATSNEAKETVDKLNVIAAALNQELVEGGF